MSIINLFYFIIIFNNYYQMSKLSIQRHGLPAELFNELFVSMPLENAFELLTKLPNGILARNVLKMVNGIKDVNLNVFEKI